MAGMGRPPIQLPRVTFRFPDELKAKLTDAATSNGRSLNEEVIARLERSFTEKASLDSEQLTLVKEWVRAEVDSAVVTLVKEGALGDVEALTKSIREALRGEQKPD